MTQSKIDLIVPNLNLFELSIPPVAQINHVEKMTGFHRSTLRRWWEEDKFPRPHKLNGTTLIWSTKTIMQWIEANIQEGVNHDNNN